jgi:hypothetical protein
MSLKLGKLRFGQGVMAEPGLLRQLGQFLRDRLLGPFGQTAQAAVDA